MTASATLENYTHIDGRDRRRRRQRAFCWGPHTGSCIAAQGRGVLAAAHAGNQMARSHRSAACLGRRSVLPVPGPARTHDLRANKNLDPKFDL